MHVFANLLTIEAGSTPLEVRRGSRRRLMARSRWLCVCVASLLVQQFQCMQWNLGVRKLSAMESSAANLSSLRLADEWRLWKRTHRKSYTSSNQELERYAIWQSNMAYIENHNKHWDKFGYTLGMNQFGDLVRKQ